MQANEPDQQCLAKTPWCGRFEPSVPRTAYRVAASFRTARGFPAHSTIVESDPTIGQRAVAHLRPPDRRNAVSARFGCGTPPALRESIATPVSRGSASKPPASGGGLDDDARAGLHLRRGVARIRAGAGARAADDGTTCDGAGDTAFAGPEAYRRTAPHGADVLKLRGEFGLYVGTCGRSRPRASRDSKTCQPCAPVLPKPEATASWDRISSVERRGNEGREGRRHRGRRACVIPGISQGGLGPSFEYDLNSPKSSGGAVAGGLTGLLFGAAIRRGRSVWRSPPGTRSTAAEARDARHSDGGRRW
jgi:hypothetical protein